MPEVYDYTGEALRRANAGHRKAAAAGHNRETSHDRRQDRLAASGVRAFLHEGRPLQRSLGRLSRVAGVLTAVTACRAAASPRSRARGRAVGRQRGRFPMTGETTTGVTTMPRRRLPSHREHELRDFEHSGIRYTAGIERFKNGTLVEIFQNTAKHGTAIDVNARRGGGGLPAPAARLPSGNPAPSAHP